MVRMAGEYRFATGDARYPNPQFEVVVYRGSAELRNQLGTTIVRAGTYAVASATSVPSLPYALNSAAWDDFDAWADEQRDARLGYASAQYLPADLRTYGGELDRAGSWDYVAGYGNVWYPYVGATWYPYSHGSWSVVGHFGWTWVGVERWSWPTHHYGRWGHHGGRWFWVPDRYWAPAWVSWSSAPGYVAWSPLGFDNRPIVNVSIHVGPRIGWSVVPRSHWKPRVYVPGVAVAHNRLQPEMWRQFADHRGGPDFDGGRGARGASPASAAPVVTGRAVPRNASRPVATPVPPRTTPGRAVPPTASRSAVRASTPPSVARPSPRDGRPVSSPGPPQTTRSQTARPRQAPPSAEPARASAAPAGRPAVTYYRGRDTAASTPPAPAPSRATDRTRSAGSGAAAPPSRVMRSTPPPNAGASTARPRTGPPAAGPSSSRSTAPGVGRGSQAPRSATPPPSAQPTRSGPSRSAPPGSAGRGSARPRGGGR